MQGVYNIDYRKIGVLALLLVAFYWLMMPGSNQPSTLDAKNSKQPSKTTEVILFS